MKGGIWLSKITWISDVMVKVLLKFLSTQRTAPALRLSSEQELCVPEVTAYRDLLFKRSWCRMNAASLKKHSGKCYQKGKLP